MRIVCPNCDAQYEVPASVIPAEGRDVECSSCGTTWFQHHPDHVSEEPAETDPVEAESQPDPAPEPEHSEDVAPQATPSEDAEDEAEEDDAPTTPAAAANRPARRPVDPGVADILREEAAREQAARKAEALEVQTDLNLDPAPLAKPDPAQPKAPPAATPTPRSETKPEPDAPEHDPNSLREPTSRRGLLPDIEEINSTLRSTADRDVAGDDLSPDAPLQNRQKRSFRRGFTLAIALVAIGALAYVFKPEIIEAAPQLAPALDSYTAMVDDARLWLNAQLTALTDWLDAQAAASQL